MTVTVVFVANFDKNKNLILAPLYFNLNMKTKVFYFGTVVVMSRVNLLHFRICICICIVFSFYFLLFDMICVSSDFFFFAPSNDRTKM